MFSDLGQQLRSPTLQKPVDHRATTLLRRLAYGLHLLVWHPYAIHGSKPNVSKNPRRILINGYAYPGATQRRFCWTLNPPRMISPRLSTSVAISRNERSRVIRYLRTPGARLPVEEQAIPFPNNYMYLHTVVLKVTLNPSFRISIYGNWDSAQNVKCMPPFSRRGYRACIVRRDPKEGSNRLRASTTAFSLAGSRLNVGKFCAIVMLKVGSLYSAKR